MVREIARKKKTVGGKAEQTFGETNKLGNFRVEANESERDSQSK